MCRDLMTIGAFQAPSEVPAKTSLSPGFQFHPTDEELVSYYLKMKVLGKPCCDAIVEIDINKHEPWDLAKEYSKLRTREQEWYFYSAMDKYGNGTRVRRRTNNGYWKTTGKDRQVRLGEKHLIGMIKTLAFYSGRAPYSLRTKWFIHEYHLLEHNQSPQKSAYVLCKLFLKKPRGNRYASFVRVMADHVPFVMDANGNNDHITEYQHQQHHDIDNNDDDDDDDEPLKTESAAEDVMIPLCVLNKEAPLPLIQYKRKRKFATTGNSLNTEVLPLCVFNKEAPLPLIQYKRKRTSNGNNSSVITQDHDHPSTTTTTTVDTSTTAMADVLLDFILTASSNNCVMRTKS